MPEPTIDEMLDTVERLLIVENKEYVRPLCAIRAILEQHRNLRPVPIGALLALRENHKLEAIRAFVDKATKHVEPLEGQPNYYGQFYIAIKEFLDEMEADNVL